MLTKNIVQVQINVKIFILKSKDAGNKWNSSHFENSNCINSNCINSTIKHLQTTQNKNKKVLKEKVDLSLNSLTVN